MDVDNRLDEHNSHRFKGSITRKAADWEVFYLLECESKSQAIKIEKHIKRMKSRKYYQSLKLYPEVSIRLKAKYQ
jgi:putative endonuclease